MNIKGYALGKKLLLFTYFILRNASKFLASLPQDLVGRLGNWFFSGIVLFKYLIKKPSYRLSLRKWSSKVSCKLFITFAIDYTSNGILVNLLVFGLYKSGS